MTQHDTHAVHDHKHGENCGHVAIKHEGHVDYLHDGHLHHGHGDHCDEHVIAVSDVNPAACKPTDHAEAHQHGADCGHPAVPHGDHTDYLVDGVLHHTHDGHCDDHGKVEVVK